LSTTTNDQISIPLSFSSIRSVSRLKQGKNSDIRLGFDHDKSESNPKISGSSEFNVKQKFAPNKGKKKEKYEKKETERRGERGDSAHFVVLATCCGSRLFHFHLPDVTTVVKIEERC